MTTPLTYQSQVPLVTETTMTNRILLVDDNQQFLTFSAEFLAAFADLEVTGSALSAQEALDILIESRPHLVIVDLAMPGTNGLEFTHQLKALMPRIPVIMLTLQDSPYYRKAALDAGADAFVAKANMDTQLVPTIRQLLEQSPHSSP